MHKITNLKATAIRFAIEDEEFPTNIVLEGQLADFFVNIIISSGLSKSGILQLLNVLLKSKDTTLLKTDKNEVTFSSNHKYPILKKPRPSNKNAV